MEINKLDLSLHNHPEPESVEHCLMPGQVSNNFYEKFIKCSEETIDFSSGHQATKNLISFDCLEIAISDSEIMEQART